jgi:tetratricopeptide (TPR) repeat protein
VQASAAVRARRSIFTFSSQPQQHIFNWAFVPGWTITEFPAFANTRTLCASHIPILIIKKFLDMFGKILIAGLFFLQFTGFTIAQQRPLPKGFPSECPSQHPTLTKEINRSPQRMLSDSLIDKSRSLGPLDKETAGKYIEIFERAIAADSTNARAYIRISDVYSGAPRFAGMQKKLGNEKSLAYFLKGYSIDPNSMDALRRMADFKLKYQNDYACAKAILARILEADPKNVLVRNDYATLLAAHSSFKAGFEQIDIMLSNADSLASPGLLDNTARIRYMAHDYDWMIAHSDKVFATNPTAPNVILHFYRALSLAELGKFEESLAEIKIILPSLKGDAGGVGALARAYIQTGDLENGKLALQELLDRHARGEHVVKYQIATVYEALGDFDNTYFWLNQVAEDGDNIQGWLLWLNHDPRWKRIRSDKRFKDIQKKAGL